MILKHGRKKNFKRDASKIDGGVVVPAGIEPAFNV